MYISMGYMCVNRIDRTYLLVRARSERVKYLQRMDALRLARFGIFIPDIDAPPPSTR
jgi:hypothetical protein